MDIFCSGSHIEQGLRRKRWALRADQIEYFGSSKTPISPEDYVAFCVLSSINKIIGFGRISEIYYQNTEESEFEWGKEKQEQKVLYPWRVVFGSVIGLKKELWVEKGIDLPKEFRDKPNPMPALLEPKQFSSIISFAEKNWNIIIRI